MKKLFSFSLFVAIGVVMFYGATMRYHARLNAQSISVGTGGIQIPGPFVYGTSGPGALASCTATANIPSMDGQVAFISNQASPYPSAAFSAAGINPTATAGTPAMHAMVYCDATQGKWFLVCP